jgi:hypothetical protein
VRAEWSGSNHVLHLLLSLVTFGLWLAVWFIASLNNGYMCSRCGGRVRAHRPPRGWQAPGPVRRPSPAPRPAPAREPRLR